MRFADIAGHDRIKEQLAAMADSGRIPHALLLEGPAGIGKLALAEAMAQYVHCTDRRGGDSCGQCPSCIQHQHRQHIDTIYVYPVTARDSGAVKPTAADFLPEWNEYMEGRVQMDYDAWVELISRKGNQPVTYVTETNALIHRLAFAAHAGSNFKIVVWWLPERMNIEASNKILKLLEEPLPDTLFIMASDRPAELLPTIYSRLHRIKVKRLPEPVVASYLEERGIGAADAKAIAHNAEGSITAAVRALDSRGAEAQMLESFKQLMRLAYQRKVAELREWASALAALGREKEMRFYDYAIRLMRENFMYNFGRPELCYLNSAESDFSLHFARFICESNVEQLITTFNDARTDIAANANGRIVNLDVAVRVILLIRRATQQQ